MPDDTMKGRSGIETAEESSDESPVADETVAETHSQGDSEPKTNGEAEPDQESPVADEALVAAVDIARSALEEITAPETIGDPAGHVVEGEHAVSLLFDCTMDGYVGWRWTVTLARVGDDSEPTVLEAELIPGENALLAPEWVPWAERLAAIQAAQAAEAGQQEREESEAASANGSGDELNEDDEDEEDDEDVDDEDEDLDADDLDDDEDDVDEDDDLDDDDDIDGVDIDELASLEVDVDESDESESEPDDRGPEGLRQSSSKHEALDDEDDDSADEPDR